MSHFAGQDVLSHLKQKRQETREAHGEEIPGHISAGLDTAREGAVVFLFLSLILFHVAGNTGALFLLFAAGWIIWRVGRSAYLSWQRLERLHRLIEQEKYEIEHNWDEEKAELFELYRAKGFEGQLLDDVVSTLMADEDRLLKVMLEEELGLTLERYEHPLKQASGAFLGAFVIVLLSTLFFFFLPLAGMLLGGIILVGVVGYVHALYEKNHLISAFIWSAALAALASGIVYLFAS